MIIVTQDELISELKTFASQILLWADAKQLETITIYGIPRGGQIVAGYLSYISPRLELANLSSHVTLFIDDIIDSGSTAQLYADTYHLSLDTLATIAAPYVRSNSFYAPEIKGRIIKHKHYLQFPWERISNVL